MYMHTLYIYTYPYIYIYTYIHIYIYIYIYIFIFIYIHCIFMQVYLYLQLYIYIYIHIHTCVDCGTKMVLQPANLCSSSVGLRVSISGTRYCSCESNHRNSCTVIQLFYIPTTRSVSCWGCSHSLGRNCPSPSSRVGHSSLLMHIWLKRLA